MRTLLKSTSIVLLLLLVVLPMSLLADDSADSPNAPRRAVGSPSFSAAPFVMRAGVIVDPNGSAMYVMRPGTGTEAVDLASGRTIWKAPSAEKPLRVSGDLLVAVTGQPKEEMEEGEAPSSVNVVFLRARDGQLLRTVSVPLPEGVWSSVDDGPGRSLRLAAEFEQSVVVLSWMVEEQVLSGMAPPASVLREESATTTARTRGVVRIDPASGRISQVPITKAAITKDAFGSVIEAQLPNVSG